MNTINDESTDSLGLSDGLLCAVLDALSDKSRLNNSPCDISLKSAIQLRNLVLEESRRADNLSFDFVYSSASREIAKLQPQFELLVVLLMFDLYHRQTPIIPVELHDTLSEIFKLDDPDQDVARMTASILPQANGIVFSKLVTFINYYPSQTTTLGPYLFQRKVTSQFHTTFLSKCVKKKTIVKMKSVSKLLSGAVENLFHPDSAFLHLCNLSHVNDDKISRRRELIRICKFIKFNRNEAISQSPAVESIYKMLKVKIRNDAALQILRNWKLYRLRRLKQKELLRLNLQSMESEKAHLHEVLKAYETKFEVENRRKVTNLADIRPVMKEYKRYKEIKKALKAMKP